MEGSHITEGRWKAERSLLVFQTAYLAGIYLMKV